MILCCCKKSVHHLPISHWLQVRMAALGVLNVLFDGTKQFLMVAEDRSVYFGLEVIGIVCREVSITTPF